MLTHDLLGNLTQVRHPNGIGSTTLHYDLGGRKTSMDDPDLGRWTYAHDRQGRLTRQTDARGKTTCLYYDGYGRLRGKHFRTNTSCPGSVSSYDVRYTYDQHHGSANRSRGQLTQVYYQRSGGYYKNLYYNSQGLLVREQVRIPGQGLLNSWYGYDRYQRPTTLTYPDGEVVTTWYNSMGLPAKLVSGASTTLVNGTINVHAASDAVNYDEAGRLRQMRFPAGGNLWQTRKYHSWTSGNGRLWEIRIGTGSNEAQRTNYNQLQLGYAYDSFGNVMVNSERFGLGAWPQYRHCYDGQNRLVRAYAQYATKPTKIPACDGNLPTSERYAYDEVGRFKYFNTTGTDYRYKTPQDTGHQHGVKWIDIGDGSTTNQTVKIRARGSNPNQWPRMELWINGVKKQTWTVTTGRWSDYTASVPLTGQDQIDVVFPNDNRTGGVDANLYIDWIQVNGVTYQEGQAIIDRGAGSNAFDGNDILVGGNLYWNGALRFVAGGGGTALGYDANGNMSYKLQPGAAMLYEWNHENRLATVKRNGVTTDQYLYDENGQRIKQTSMAGGTTVYVNGRYELSNEEVWVDDAIPGGATLTNGKDGWNWDTTEKVSGRAAHRSALQSGIHQHYFTNAKETMAIKSGDTLYAYIYLDPDHPPQAVMLQWNDGDWNQRAYWGQNLINWGTNGTSSRRYMGRLPASGGWVRLEVPAAHVGLAGKTVNGLAFTLYGGRAWWDRAGVRRAVHEVTKYYEFNGQRIARRQDGVLTYLHTDHLGSTLLATNSSGAMVGEHRYRAYGSSRGGDELATDHRFTGQKDDGTGLYYYNARYYDPALGAFISPDTIVPDAGNLFAYNRFMYTLGNPLKYSDPTGHYALCFNEGSQPGIEAGEDNANRHTAVHAICSQLAEDGLLGASGEFEIFGSNREGAAKALAYLKGWQELYPDEKFIILGYSWGGGAAIEFVRALNPLFSWDRIKVDALITIDPVVGGRWWKDRQIAPPMVSWFPLPFIDVRRSFNLLAEKNVYGGITPWDQGVELPGGNNQVMTGVNHCTIGHAGCPNGAASMGFAHVPDASGGYNQTTYSLIADFLKE